MTTTPSPCSRRRRISVSTCSVCSTPSAAVGSSRMTTFACHMTAREIATDWRWPPESETTRCRTLGIVVTCSPSSTSSERFSISSSWSGPSMGGVRRLAAEEHVRDDVEVVAEREILVDGLDAEPRRVARRVDLRLVALDEDRPGVGQVRPRDALDQRRLAGAVVADERHDLAGVHLEVDVRQRLHGAEALRDAAQLEDRLSVGEGAASAPPPPLSISAVSVCSYSQMLTFGMPLQTFARPPNWLLIQPFVTSLLTFDLSIATTGQVHGRTFFPAALIVPLMFVGFLPLQDRGGDLRCRRRLETEVLERRHALVALDHVLDALERGILAGGRHLALRGSAPSARR